MNHQQQAVYTLLSFLAKLPLWGWLALVATTVIVFVLVFTSLIK